MKKIVVLGVGRVGKAIAVDLMDDFDVTAVDTSDANLKSIQTKYSIKTLNADISEKEKLNEIVKDFDLVIGAVPGFIGFQTVKNVIEAGKDIVDISFFPEDPFLLNEIAKANNVTAVIDCGVAPGMGNIILGFHNKNMMVESYECLVGGLPVEREWPFQYKAPFSPADVIEEYMRAARIVENGNVVVKEALSEPVLEEFKGIGKLEAWNSDGLRTLIKTMKVPNMVEKTLRYPGSLEYIKVLRECGFFSKKEIDLNGVTVRPLDLTSKLLFPKWKLNPGDDEFTVMRIKIQGTEKGNSKNYQYYLFDKYDPSSGTTSMARTTGYTCSAVVHLLLTGQLTKKGLIPPEHLGEENENFEFILNYLRARGVNYESSNY